MMCNAILLISCPDHRGIVARVSTFLFENNGNVIDSNQHIDEQTNTFFMRIEWSLNDFVIEKDRIADAFAPIADQFDMSWELSFTDEPQRMAIFVSKHLHCLYDLLYRYRDGKLRCEIPLIISNHADARQISEECGIQYYEFPITQENKEEQERKEIDLLLDHQIDFVVLARYHQILSPNFVRIFSSRIINIHHSFLPAFVGKSPYAQAYQKGVKIIGGTSHYVTEQLDQGPIIEQDTIRVSHRDDLDDLIQKGEDLEKVVFSRAIRWHLERKILCYNNKTVVFD